jgi:hypothetical protein
VSLDPGSGSVNEIAEGKIPAFLFSNNEFNSMLAFYNNAFGGDNTVCDDHSFNHEKYQFFNDFPVVVSTYPNDGAQNVSVDIPYVSVTFDRQMYETYSWNPPFLNPQPNYSVFESPSTFINYNNSGIPLAYNTTYTITLDAGGFWDLSGTLIENYSFSFTTEPAPIDP